MLDAYTEALFKSVPTEDVAVLAVVFALAGLLLFVLSVEAGNYPRITEWFRQAHSALRRLRGRHWRGETISA